MKLIIDDVRGGLVLLLFNWNETDRIHKWGLRRGGEKAVERYLCAQILFSIIFKIAFFQQRQRICMKSYLCT
jgi:hypothetical protein